MAEEMNSGTPSEKLRVVRDHIRFENAHDLAAVRGSGRSA
jgi:hypothetical protein